MVADAHLAGVDDGLIAVVKSECPTCQLISPVLTDLANRAGLTVYSQDDPTFPTQAEWVIDDTNLDTSWYLDLESVPTLLRVDNGAEVERTIGWDREKWQDFTGVDELGADLPPFRPG